jgi:hypothetical protein
MSARWKVPSAPALARYDELPLTNVPLFGSEDYSGCLLSRCPAGNRPATGEHRAAATDRQQPVHASVLGNLAAVGKIDWQGRAMKSPGPANRFFPSIP